MKIISMDELKKRFESGFTIYEILGNSEIDYMSADAKVVNTILDAHIVNELLTQDFKLRERRAFKESINRICNMHQEGTLCETKFLEEISKVNDSILESVIYFMGKCDYEPLLEGRREE